MNPSAKVHARRRISPVVMASMLGAALLALVVSHFVQAQGIGFMGDTARFYEFGARSGLSSLPIHDAPLYPLVLRLHAWTPLSIEAFSGWLNRLLYPLVTVLLLIGLYSLSRSIGPSLIATFVTAFSWPFISVYSFAQTEVLFLPCMTASLFLFLRADLQGSYARLIPAGLFAALGMLDRYAGVYALLAAGFYVLAVNRLRFVRSVLQMMVFGLSAGLPFLALMLWNMTRAGDATSRVLAFHPPSLAKLQGGLYWIMNFFLPYRLLEGSFVASLILLIAICAGVVVGYRLYASESEERYGVTCLTWTAAYVLFLYVSLSLFDDHTPLDERLLSPLTLTALCGAIYGAALYTTRGSTLFVRSLGLLFILYMTAFTAHRAWGFVDVARQNGLGFSRREVRESPSLAEAVKRSKTHRIYSNAPEAATLLYGAEGFFGLPYKISPTSLLPNPAYGEQMARLKEEMRGGTALVALFYFKHKPGVWTHYLPDGDEIRRLCDAVELRSFEDGVLIGAASSPLD